MPRPVAVAPWSVSAIRLGGRRRASYEEFDAHQFFERVRTMSGEVFLNDSGLRARHGGRDAVCVGDHLGKREAQAWILLEQQVDEFPLCL